MDLQDVWFALIAVLWVGYFVLEGFDFGVGMLLPFLGKDDMERRLLINSIGPVWDGNEVWLLVAGGATFAAFPEWYATLFSGFYLPLFLILLGLIVRGVSFEYRGKSDDPAWRTRWDWTIFVGSALPALLWGVAFANILNGLKIVHRNSGFHYVGGFFELLNPYAILGGVTTVLLFLAHGAIFLAMKNSGVLRDRAKRYAALLTPFAAVATITFLVWTYLNARSNDHFGLVPWAIPVVSMIAVSATVWLVRERHEGWAFAANALGIALLVVTIFLNLYPNVMPSSINDAYNMTVDNASSSPYTLKVMTIVAGVMVPIVVAYQGFTYWIFRKRLVRPETAVLHEGH